MIIDVIILLLQEIFLKIKLKKKVYFISSLKARINDLSDKNNI